MRDRTDAADPRMRDPCDDFAARDQMLSRARIAEAYAKGAISAVMRAAEDASDIVKRLEKAPCARDRAVAPLCDRMRGRVEQLSADIAPLLGCIDAIQHELGREDPFLLDLEERGAASGRKRIVDQIVAALEAASPEGLTYTQVASLLRDQGTRTGAASVRTMLLRMLKKGRVWRRPGCPQVFYAGCAEAPAALEHTCAGPAAPRAHADLPSQGSPDGLEKAAAAEGGTRDDDPLAEGCLRVLQEAGDAGHTPATAVESLIAAGIKSTHWRVRTLLGQLELDGQVHRRNRQGLRFYFGPPAALPSDSFAAVIDDAALSVVNEAGETGANAWEIQERLRESGHAVTAAYAQGALARLCHQRKVQRVGRTSQYAAIRGTESVSHAG